VAIDIIQIHISLGQDDTVVMLYLYLGVLNPSFDKDTGYSDPAFVIFLRPMLNQYLSMIVTTSF
jgi:hypothetical protein